MLRSKLHKYLTTSLRSNTKLLLAEHCVVNINWFFQGRTIPKSSDEILFKFHEKNLKKIGLAIIHFHPQTKDISVVQM